MTKSAPAPLANEVELRQPSTRLFALSARYRWLGTEPRSTATRIGPLSPDASTVFAALCTKSGCPNSRSAIVSPVAAGSRVTSARVIGIAIATVRSKAARRVLPAGRAPLERAPAACLLEFIVLPAARQHGPEDRRCGGCWPRRR